MWDSRPRLSQMMTAEGGCPTREKMLDLFFRGSLGETVAALPGGFGSVHAIRLGIEPFAELGANSSSLSGSEVDSSCSRRAILGLAPVTVLQSPFSTVLPLADRVAERPEAVDLDLDDVARLEPDGGLAMPVGGTFVGFTPLLGRCMAQSSDGSRIRTPFHSCRRREIAS